jgi:hypothetical protein
MRKSNWIGPLSKGGTRVVSVAHVVSAGKTTRGDEIWHISSADNRLTLTTSSTSAAIMDDAVEIYSDALERLAKR